MSNKIIAICWDHSFVPIDFRDLISLDNKTIKKVITLSKEINTVSELAILSTCNRIEFYAFSKKNEDLFCIIKSVYKMFLNTNYLGYSSLIVQVQTLIFHFLYKQIPV